MGTRNYLKLLLDLQSVLMCFGGGVKKEMAELVVGKWKHEATSIVVGDPRSPHNSPAPTPNPSVRCGVMGAQEPGPVATGPGHQAPFAHRGPPGSFCWGRAAMKRNLARGNQLEHEIGSSLFFFGPPPASETPETRHPSCLCFFPLEAPPRISHFIWDFTSPV